MKKIIIITCCWLAIVCCKNKTVIQKEINNDTTKVIEFALNICFKDENLPGLSPLRIKHKYGDSILFTTDIKLISLLPKKVGSVTFKIIPLHLTCTTILSDSYQIQFPNYLYLRNFETSDSGYYISLQSLSCVPFGGGGGIGIYTNKKVDSLYVKQMLRSSIN